jgi:single-strand DNA-binding protein
MTSFKHENIVLIAGVLGADPQLRHTTSGRQVATLIVYTNHLVRNGDGTSRQDSQRHQVVVWGMHAEKAARLLSKGSRIRVQGRMTYPKWQDSKTGETRYGAEIVAQTLDYVGADEEEAPQVEQPAPAPTPQPAETAAPLRSQPRASAAARRRRPLAHRTERRVGARKYASSPLFSARARVLVCAPSRAAREHTYGSLVADSRPS